MPERRSAASSLLCPVGFSVVMEADFDKTSLRFTLRVSFEPASHTGSNAAQMAELVDALGSGPSGGNTVEVRVLFWAPCHAGAAQTPSFVFNGHEGADLNLQVPYCHTAQRAEQSTDCLQDTHSSNRV